MTTTENEPLEPGALIHFLRPMFAFGYPFARGDQHTVTSVDLELTRDRNGASWADDLSEDAQRERWGELRIARGPWPAGKPRWIAGTPEWEEAREAARKVAWSHADPEERAQALSELERVYGPGPETSWTVNAAPAKQQTPSGRVSR